MQKKEQSSQQVVICYFMEVMSVDVDEARLLLSNLENAGLVHFDPNGEMSLLVLEGQS